MIEARKVLCTPGICGGNPRMDGTRLTCADLVIALSSKQVTIEQYIANYKETAGYEITQRDIKNCLEYCATQQCIEDSPESFCCGCSLDISPEEEPEVYVDSIENALTDIVSRPPSKGYIFLGSREDYERTRRRRDLWLEAQRLNSSLH